jgi:uncharacterized protein YjbI with pentapeptide repeats
VEGLHHCPVCGEQMQAGSDRCPYCATDYGPPTRASVLSETHDLAGLALDDADSIVLAYLRGIELRGAHLGGVDLADVNLAAADLRGADLGAADLQGAILRKADLSGANLAGADLRGADLCGCDLSRTNLTHAQLKGARYDAYTVWPEDLDPAEMGAVRADQGSRSAASRDIST